MTDLMLYLTRTERDEAWGLAWGAGVFTQNDIRLLELEHFALERRATQLGTPEASDD